MNTRQKIRTYTVLALVLCLCLTGAAAAPRAASVELPAVTLAPEQNGMYELLTQVFDSYHAGTAGCSLKAAYLSASMVDWACENGQAAARAAALAWDRGTETEFGELFSDKMEAMYSAAVQLCRGGEGVLADCGYQGTWTHTEAEVRETFENLFQGLGMTVPPELRIGPAPMSTADHGVSVTFDHESEEFFTQDGQTKLLTYACDVPIVSVPGDPAVQTAIRDALEEEHRLFADGPEDPQGDLFGGREYFLQIAGEQWTEQNKTGYADYFIPYLLQRTADIARSDGRVLSVLFDDTSYTGGAHGWTGRYGHVFDAVTGEKLTLDALSETPDAFRSFLEEELLRLANSAEYAMYYFFDDYREYLPGLLREDNWYLGRNGLVVIANPYEIAPYAVGMIEFTIPYDRLSWALKAAYLPGEDDSLGELEGEITPETVTECTYFVSDGEEIASTIVLTARGRVEDLSVRRVSMSWDDFTYWPGELLWSGSSLEDGETLVIRNQIPDVSATLSLTFTGRDGEQTYYLFQSGMDGSLILQSERDHARLPLEISGQLPYTRDINGDGAAETIDLRQTGSNGAWQLYVNGQAVNYRGYALSSYLRKLWLCDLDYDGVCEIFYSGDLGSDDYITCGWHGDTLEPIWFNPMDGTGAAESMDGELVFSAGTPVIHGWVYQMGTYAAYRICDYSREGLFSPAVDSEWSYRGNTYALTLRRDLPVTFDLTGQTGTVPAGSSITLTGSDGDIARFVTADGRTGVISLEHRTDGFASGWFIDGVSENEYFDMLPYAG